MSRELKFRAWNGESMEYGGFAIHATVGSIVDIHSISSVTKKSPVMQYTGLKDKNGKEIYEGDVVRHPYGFGNGWGEVTYWPPMFKLQSDDGTCDEIGFDECEVIGNIYENKDLLS